MKAGCCSALCAASAAHQTPSRLQAFAFAVTTRRESTCSLGMSPIRLLTRGAFTSKSCAECSEPVSSSLVASTTSRTGSLPRRTRAVSCTKAASCRNGTIAPSILRPA
eukprot:10662-Heterococcus_DN1.PRE.1